MNPLQKSKSMSEMYIIGGVEALVNFKHNRECLDTEVMQVTKRGLVFNKQLIPHGQKELSWEDEVPTSYKVAVIHMLNKWYTEGLLEPSEWNPSDLRYWTEFRAFAHLYDPKFCLPVSGLDLLQEFCKIATIHDILNPRLSKLWFLTPFELSEYKRRCQLWVSTNSDYLLQKAKDLATFWVDQVGTLGISGNGLADFFHASMSPTKLFQKEDLDKLHQAIVEYGISEFKQGAVPCLSTDYGVDYQLCKILKTADLSHLTNSFPWKTIMRLDFNDINRTILLQRTLAIN